MAQGLSVVSALTWASTACTHDQLVFHSLLVQNQSQQNDAGSPDSFANIHHSNGNISRIEGRLLALETMLRSVVTKTSLVDQASVTAAGTSTKNHSSRERNGSSHRRDKWLQRCPECQLYDSNRSATECGPAAGYCRRDGRHHICRRGCIWIFWSAFLWPRFHFEPLTSLGPTSNSAFFSHISSAMREPGAPSLQQSAAHGVSSADSTYISRPPSPRPLIHETLRSNARTDPVDVFILPPETKIIHLVDLFFTDMGLLFPYIYKRSILDGLAEMKTTHFRGVRRSWLCLLNTILTFATCLTATPYERKEDCAAEADVFLQRALKLLPNIALEPANLEVCKYLKTV